ncbi:hypothetical protein NS184_04795 [Curtobacterium luteum]|uniref:Uncharacterized protein n=1 Tax=Curtobacterium luteum TaxID=33881 RepID=A0A175RYW4_9MICO|nr:hypothetical protein NS184_04795 [Curtobacterium luteum]
MPWSSSTPGTGVIVEVGRGVDVPDGVAAVGPGTAVALSATGVAVGSTAVVGVQPVSASVARHATPMLVPTAAPAVRRLRPMTVPRSCVHSASGCTVVAGSAVRLVSGANVTGSCPTVRPSDVRRPPFVWRVRAWAA